MKFSSNNFFVFFEDRGTASKVAEVIRKKYPEEKNNRIVTAFSSLPNALKSLEKYYRKKIFFDIIIFDLRFSLNTRQEFVDAVMGKQAIHEFILIGNEAELQDEDKEFIKSNKIFFLNDVNEFTLFSLLENIFEKKFNENKYALINRIDDIVNLKIASNEILKGIVDNTLEYLNLKTCWIALINHETGGLQIGSLTGFGEFEKEYREIFDISLNDTAVTTECIHKKEQVQYRKVLAKNCPFKYEKFAKKIGLKSILVTPIFAKGTGDLEKVVGTLNLYTYFHHTFQDDELELARIIAAKTAVVLSMKDMYEEEKDETRKKLELIERVAAEININVINPKDVFETIVDESLKLVNADRGCISLSHNGLLTREYHKCKSQDCDCRNCIFPTMNHYIIEKKKSLLSGDINKDPLYKDAGIEYKDVNSRISVPLMLDENVVGILTAEHQEKNYFNRNHLRFFEALARHAVIAIENSKRNRQLHKRLHSQLIIKGLIEETSKLAAIEDEEKRNEYRITQLDKIIKVVIQKTGEIFDAESGFVVLAGFLSNYAIRNPRWQFGLKETDLPELEIGVLDNGNVIFPDEGKKCITGKVIAEGRLYNCGNVANDDFYLEYGKNDKAVSEIVLPLKFQSQTFGAFALDSSKENAFSEEDAQILESIATQMALLIKRFRHLNTLLDLNKPFKNIDNLDQLYNEIPNRTVEALDTRVSYLRILDRNELIVKGCTGIKKKNISLPLQVGEGVSGGVAQTHKPEIIPNVQDPVFGYRHLEFARKNKLFALISVPIFSTGPDGKKDLTGVLNTYANRICNFTSFDQQLMQLLAEKAGEAIKKAKLIKQLDVIAKVDEKLTTTTERSVLQDIANIAKNLLDAAQVVLYQYNSNIAENFGFSTPATASGEFKYEKFKFPTDINEDSLLVLLLDQKSNEFFVESYEKDLIEKIYSDKVKNSSATPFYQREQLKSVIILKLTYRKEIVGILFINYRYQKSFSPEEQRIAKTFASKAAIAISNIRKYEDIDRLHSVGNVIAVEPDIEKVLEKIASNAKLTLKADSVILHKYDSNKKEIIQSPISLGNIYDAEAMVFGGYSQENVQYRVIEYGRDVFASDVKKNKIFGRGEDWVTGEKRIPRFIDREEIQSCAAMLLKVRRETVGIMFINYRNKQKFDSQQKRIIKIFANQAAIAIRNANLIEESRQAVNRIKNNLAAIQESGNTIVKSLRKKHIEKHDILKPTLEKAIELINVDMGYIGIIEKEESKMKVLACSEKYNRLENKFVNYIYSDSKWVQNHKRFDIYYDGKKNCDYQTFSKNPHLLSDPGLNFTEDKNIRSALRVPIYSSDRELLGMIILESETKNAFSENDAYTVVSLANQASLALQNYKLILQLKKLRIVDSAILKEQNNLEKIFEIILGAALDLVKKKYADIKLLLDKRNLIIKKSKRVSVEGRIVDVKKCLSGIAVEKRKTYCERNVLKNPRFLETPGVETKSELVIPLMVDGRPIGVLNIESEEFDDFSKEDIKILEMLAGQASIAIVSAQNYGALQKAKRELENSFNREAFVGFNRMHNVFEHQINNSVGVIRVKTIDLLKKRDKFDTGTVKALELILKNAKIALNAPNEATTKADDLLFAEREKVDLLKIFTKIKETLEDFSQDRKIELRIETPDNLPFVESNFSLLYEGVFAELIRNAIKAMPKGGEVKIEAKEVAGKTKKDDIEQQIRVYLEIRVSDNGCGISPRNQRKVFEHGFSVWSDRKGKGIGLFYMKAIIDSLHGNINCKSNKPKGTIFVIRLPIGKNNV